MTAIQNLDLDNLRPTKTQSRLDQVLLALGVEQTLALFTEDEWNKVLHDWWWNAREGQFLPDGNWFTWSVIAGRGFGKTWIGAKAINEWAMQGEPHPMYVIGATTSEVRETMVEGVSGILATAPPWFRPEYFPSKRLIIWPNGARARTRSAEKFERLRGPQGSKAWVDEFPSWQYPEESWEQINMMIRLGDPRIVMTTTPRPIRILREILAEHDTHITKGHTDDNRHNLSAKFMERVYRKYEGTRLGLQELKGAMLDDNPNALWSLRLIDQNRKPGIPEAGLRRIVVPVDPQGSTKKKSYETGIVVVGAGMCSCKGQPEEHGFVLEDVSDNMTPAEWADETVEAYERHKADKIVGETNFGGEMVEHTIRTHDRGAHVPFKMVTASRGKARRAEPIVSLYEQGKIHHVGAFAKLEDEMTQWDPLDPSAASPNRMDSLVWGLTELFIEGQPAQYRTAPMPLGTSRYPVRRR